jgi:heme A synthase
MIEIRQYQWLILALVGGASLILSLVLAYLALWRRREGVVEEGPERPEQASKGPTRGWLRSFLPWILIVTYVGLLSWGLAYTLWVARHPPNW